MVEILLIFVASVLIFLIVSPDDRSGTKLR
jgi:hypothetical protein